MNKLSHLLNKMLRIVFVRRSVLTIVLLCGFAIFSFGKGSRATKDSIAGKTGRTLVNTSPVIRLEIHHININNGDASVIRLVHKDGTETKVLIDGGQPDPNVALLPYIKNRFANSKFDYTILTHYHNDHYDGLTALGNGSITSEYYIDLGGYNMAGDVDPGKLSSIQPNDITCPWTDSTGVFEGTTMLQYLKLIGNAANKYGLKRYMPMSKDNDHIQDLIGVKILLGAFAQGTNAVPIELRCVAAWGFTQGNNQVVDDWKKGASKNDPSLAFVLECGEFRYFFGGDMGGDRSGSYIDQETTLAQGFAYLYTGAKSWINPGTTYSGHICGFKANHHGSAHSNNSTFLGQMHAAVCVTSAGDNSGWHLPSVAFIQRLNATTPVTPATAIPDTVPVSVKAQGFFFTNLFNFGGSNNSLSAAQALFHKRARTAFYYGSASQNLKAGYIVFVDLTIPNIDFTKKSVFAVVDVGSDYKLSPQLAVIHCHQK